MLTIRARKRANLVQIKRNCLANNRRGRLRAIIRHSLNCVGELLAHPAINPAGETRCLRHAAFIRVSPTPDDIPGRLPFVGDVAAFDLPMSHICVRKGALRGNQLAKTCASRDRQLRARNAISRGFDCFAAALQIGLIRQSGHSSCQNRYGSVSDKCRGNNACFQRLILTSVLPMQPIFVTLTSSGSSPWKVPNAHATPQQLSMAVISTGGSSWFIDVAFEDPTNTYPSPNSSLPTAFTILTGSSNQFISVGVGSTIVSEIAAYRITLNAPSSAGAKIMLAVNQAGVG
jgi:hypothetical protein